MRTIAILALSLLGCASEVLADLEPDDWKCRPRNGGPNCNGDRRADECRAAGLPDAYGVDLGCEHPVRPTDDGECARRPQGTYRCLERGDLLCCYR